MEEAVVEIRSADPATRLRGVRRLALVRTPEALQVLLPLMDDPDPHIRAQVAISLGETHAGEVLPVLLEHLKTDASAEVRGACILALEECEAEEVTPALVAALSDPDEDVVQLACRTLSDPAARAPLLALLEDPRRRVREEASRALWDLGTRDPRLVLTLEQLREMPAEPGRPREWMEDALDMIRAEERGEVGPQAEQRRRDEAFQKAERALREGTPEERREAAMRLGGLEGPRAVAALLPALEDPAPGVRSTAALYLGMWAVPEALPGLKSHLLNDESLHVRRLCSAFMHYFPGEEVLETLTEALNDPDWGVQSSACVGLGVLGLSRAVPHLMPLLQHPQWNVRLQASWALVKLKAADPRLVSALEQLAEDPEAIEYDLEMDEMEAAFEEAWQEDGEPGEPAPEPGPKVGELLEQARRLLDEQRPGPPGFA